MPAPFIVPPEYAKAAAGIEPEDKLKMSSPDALSRLGELVGQYGLIGATPAEEDSNDLFKRITEQYRAQQEAGNIGLPPTPEREPTTTLPTQELVSSLPKMDDELEKALEYQRQMRGAGAISGAFSRLGAAIAGKGAGAVIKPELAGAKELEKLGEAEVRDVLTKRKAKADLMDLQDAKAMADPKSTISKALREGASSVGVAIPENVSGSQLKAAGLNLGSLLNAKMATEARAEAAAARREASQENRKLRKEQFEYRKERDIQRASERFSQYLESDPEMKQIKKENLALGQVKRLVDLSEGGNTVAAAGLGAKTARAMGEVGVLTEEDVARYVRSGALIRGTDDKLKKWIKGSPTKATLDEIRQISQVIQDSFMEKIQPMYDKYATRLSRIYNIPLDEAYYVIGGQRPGQKIVPTDEDIDNMSPEELKEYLKK